MANIVSNIKRVLTIFSVIREAIERRLASFLPKPRSGYRTLSRLTTAQTLKRQSITLT